MLQVSLYYGIANSIVTIRSLEFRGWNRDWEFAEDG